MIPLGFADLADAPTIILSPHQHQFDPISSRAAHSYTIPINKPIMPSKPWDPTPSRAIQSSASKHVKKRSRDQVEDEEKPTEKASMGPTPTPRVSPETGHEHDVPMKDPTTGLGQAFGEKLNESLKERLVDENKGNMEAKLEEEPRPTAQRQDSGSKRQRRSSRSQPTGAGMSESLVLTQMSVPPQPSSSTGPDYSQLIGIGWIGHHGDPDTMSSWRGIARVFEQQLGLTDVEIIAMNEHSEACLVNAAEGYHSVPTVMENTRLLSTNREEAFLKLRCVHSVEPETGSLGEAKSNQMDVD